MPLQQVYADTPGHVQVNALSGSPAHDDTAHTIAFSKGNTPTTSSVAASASSVQIAGGDNTVRSRIIVNDSSSKLRLRYGASAASPTAYTWLLQPYDAIQIDDFNGAIQGIWETAVGNAVLTVLKT